MTAAESIKVTQDRVSAARKGSGAWALGLPVKPYVWRRNDPERDAKIAEERRVSAQKSAAAKRNNAHDALCLRAYGAHERCSCELVCTRELSRSDTIRICNRG